jgi:uncharacterized protein YpuA (DUF1002 family)
MSPDELINAKKNINIDFTRQINELYEMFDELDDISLRSYNSKKHFIKVKIIDSMKALNEKIQRELVW